MAKSKSSNITAIISIIVGIIILIWADALRIAVALFLILYGLLNVFDK